MEAKDVLDEIKRSNVRFVDLQFTDLPGRMQHTTVPARTLDDDALKNGVPKLDGSSIKGFVEIEESDMVLKPDPATFAIIPWIREDLKTARTICDVYWGFGKGRLAWDPRAIAQRAEEYLREEGYTLSYWGPEVEFFVFDKVNFDVLQPYRGMSYSIESKEAVWNSPGINFPIRFKEGYFPAAPQDTLMDFRAECTKILEENFHVPCDAHHHEVSTAGQCEIDFYRDTLTNMADNVMTEKFVLKNMASRAGMIATFMPKPIFMDNASGMHTHVSLWKGKDNLFYDPSDTHSELSQIARYFIGGLLEHGRALSAIVSPTTNSYRRLVPGYEAPVYISWSRSNRSSTVRVPIYQKGPAAAGRKRVEYRPPDPSSNPYLALSAILAAGLDGVRKKIDPGEPTDENVYKMSLEKRRQLGIKEIPGSLKEAVELLQSDREFLTKIFPREALDKMIEMEQVQQQEIDMRPHPYEFYLYLDI